MRTIAIVSLFVVATGLVGSLSNAAEDSPYILAKKEFKKQIRTVSLSPLDVPPAFKLNTELHAYVEAEATKELGKTKLKFIPIETYAGLRDKMTQQVGGLQKADGKPDFAKKSMVWDHAKREMRFRHPIDGFAEISLRPVSAIFSKDKAQWDGVSQKVNHSGDGFSLFGGKDYEGSIAAASFQLAIFDRADKLVYLHRGGIEILQERQGSKLVLLDDSVLFQDQKKLRKAVRLAFKPL